MTSPHSPDSTEGQSLRGVYILALVVAFGTIALLYWFTATWNQPLPEAR